MASKGKSKALRWGWRLFVVGLLIGGWALASAALHVVVVPADDMPGDVNVVIVPKNRLGIDQTYVDTRGWTPQTALDHEALVYRLIEAGKTDQLNHILHENAREHFDELHNRRRTMLEAVADVR